MFIDKKSDVAYLLLNVDNANKGKDGSHDPSAERVDIKYFIRSELLNKINQNVTQKESFHVKFFSLST